MRTGSTVAARVLSLGIVVAALGGFVSLAVLMLPDGVFAGQLNPGGEGNAFGWASTVATFAAAYASLLLAFAIPAQLVRLTVLSACFALLSLDDAVLLHERFAESVVRDRLGVSDNIAQQIELVIWAPLFAIALWIVWDLVRESSGRASRVLLGGFSLLGLAVFCEGVAGIVTRRLEKHGVDHVNGFRLAIEEASELTGWILVATALTALACSALAADEDGPVPL